jgi:ABC-type phosphate transport system substrate-binding protein
MSRFKLHLAAGAGALAASLAGSAGAQTVIHLNGAGSSLIAPVWEQAAKCWDPSTEGGVSLYQNGKFAKVPATSGTTDPLVTAAAIMGCFNPANNVFFGYVASGSGAGQAALLTHDGRQDLLGDNPDATHTKPFDAPHYALSDSPMTSNDVGVYTVGSGQDYTDTNGTIRTPAAFVAKQFTPAQTVSLTFGGSPGPNNYDIPRNLYGPLVQFPVSIDAVAITFNPQYKPGKMLNIVTAAQKLNLDSDTYCKIFTGLITDWGDPALTALNVNPRTGLASPLVQTADVGNSPITLVGRSDSSGTTLIFTRHLARVCGGIYGRDGTNSLPGGSPFTDLKSGGSGVATEVHAVAGSMGYVGIDYVSPFSKKSGANTYNLPAAKLKNAFGAFELPTAGTASAAFTGTGFSMPAGQALRSDPSTWAPSPAATVAPANPVQKTAYPIVGTTQFLGYTCYASADTVTAIRGFLTFLNTTKGKSILRASGLAPLPIAWTTAITQTFLTPTATTKTYNLFLAHAGDGADGQGDTNTNCTDVGIIGG